MFKAIIVDDEELAAGRLRRLLGSSGAAHECRTFSSPLDAYEYAKANQPIDVAFLDISMPRLNGMELSDLLTELNGETAIVFVTGYDKYAVQAFDKSALDYLLKPVDEARLGRTLDKIRKRFPPSVSVPDATVLLFDGYSIFAGGSARLPLRLRSPKTEELFAYLILRRTTGRDEIVEALWPELDPDKAQHNLNTNVYYIRKAFEGAGAKPVIRTGRHEVGVEENVLYCDVHEFDRIVKSRPADGASVDMARRLYAGSLLSGKDYSWASEYVHMYEKRYAVFLETAAREFVSRRQGETALAL